MTTKPIYFVNKQIWDKVIEMSLREHILLSVNDGYTYFNISPLEIAYYLFRNYGQTWLCYDVYNEEELMKYDEKCKNVLILIGDMLDNCRNGLRNKNEGKYEEEINYMNEESLLIRTILVSLCDLHDELQMFIDDLDLENSDTLFDLIKMLKSMENMGVDKKSIETEIEQSFIESQTYQRDTKWIHNLYNAIRIFHNEKDYKKKCIKKIEKQFLVAYYSPTNPIGKRRMIKSMEEFY